ncbi:TetR/AcrR family transcriptional regulator [Cohnella sp. CFH 77786]|uniref:TetR/AcrR family transcriptional regulator n=1 Tax=Cohnella sp. CFH 77786 TaxID=2662265 RepID=UPI00351CEDB9
MRKATLDLLRESDPKRIRIADIAKAARVSQVTIYNYFGSKEELLRDVFKHYVDKASRQFEAFINEGHTLKEKIEYLLIQKRAAMAEFPPRLIKEMLTEDPELARYLEQRYKEKSLPLTLRLIREGRESGEISEDVSDESVLVLMQLYMNQYETILGMAEQSGDTDAFFRGLVHMFFYGICGKP